MRSYRVAAPGGDVRYRGELTFDPDYVTTLSTTSTTPEYMMDDLLTHLSEKPSTKTTIIIV